MSPAMYDLVGAWQGNAAKDGCAMSEGIQITSLQSSHWQLQSVLEVEVADLVLCNVLEVR